MPGPLEGVRVVELAGIGPAPFCAMLLADLGADVLRIDRPSGGSSLNTRPEYDLLNRGKRAVVVDLKSDRGAETVLRLAERADILIEGFRPGVAERLGIGPEPCLGHNPRLVYGRMTGWGQQGPLAQRAGHDIAYIAITGVLGAIGRAGGPPQVPLNLVGDFAGGSLYLALGLLAALRTAEDSGRGQVVDAAIVDGTSHLATMIHGMMAAGLWGDRRGRNLLDTGTPFYDVYETSDAKYIAVGPLEQQFYVQLVGSEGLDLHDLPAQLDMTRWPELRQRIAGAFGQRTQDEWTKIFDGTDACVAPVLSLSEAPRHPHLAARKVFVEQDGVVQPAPAPRFSETPASLGRGPAEPGTHTREALLDWGLTDVDQLLESGTVVQREA